MALTTKRIIALPSQNDPQEGDYLAIDNMQNGTHKIPVGRIGVEVDDTLTEQGKAADAKAVGDALDEIRSQAEATDDSIDEIRSQIEVTGTASGAIATFTDGSDAPMKSCMVTIEPQQSGTGTPSPDNIRPISGWTEVEPSVCGKNLWSFGDVTINSQGTFTFSKYLSSGDYSFSAVITSDDTSYSTNAVLVRYSDGTYGSIIQVGRNQRASGFFTASKEIKALSLYASTNSTTASGKTAIFKDVQLELGSTATEYEPYTATTTPVNLGRTVYGGTLDVVSGELVVDRAIVDGSNLTFTYWLDDKFYSNAVSGKTAIGGKMPISECYELINYVGNDFQKQRFYVEDASAKQDASVVNSHASGHKFIYYLAEPQTYALTPTEVNTLLGENNVWADSGDVEVVYVRDLNLAINNLLNSNGTRSLGMMAMSAPTEATAEEQTDEQTEEPSEDDMR